ncbi:hypothetical protein HYV43_03680 [Candidatus Micrarchaeota archaeon]|nr:hypothetical protein [Candidatus Micrarchaeota archaeon]
MDKPKIISMKDAFDSPPQDGDVPELPGHQSPAGVALPEEHPPEIPPERMIPRPNSSRLPGPSEPEAAVVQPVVVESSEPVAVAGAPAVVEPVKLGPVQPGAPASPVLSESVSAPVSHESETVPVEPVPPVQPPAGAPPWVEREPQTPTVSEASKPIPSYPGVGRPRINSISQGSVSLTPPSPVTAPIRPSSTPASAPAAPAGKLYDRPELDADRFAEEMAATPAPTPAQSDVVKEYRQAALPPQPPARPLTPEEERAKARSLAAQIHSDNEKQGFFGKFKRMLGLR